MNAVIHNRPLFAGSYAGHDSHAVKSVLNIRFFMVAATILLRDDIFVHR